MNQAADLDHVGVVGQDLTALATTFEQLGFHLTPLARHAGGRTGNRCVMLREGGYLELMSTIDGGTSTTLNRFLVRYAGAHILALGIEDADAVLARLRLAWAGVPDVSRTARAVDDGEAEGPRARFSFITPADPPEGRVQLIRHETPEALWQDRFLHHANNAMALDEVIMAVPEPAVTAAWYSALAGRPVVPDPAGGYVLALPRGKVRMLSPAGLAMALPGTVAPALPFIAGLSLRTGDANAALRRLLSTCAIPHRTSGDAIIAEAAGVTLRFHGV